MHIRGNRKCYFYNIKIYLTTFTKDDFNPGWGWIPDVVEESLLTLAHLPILANHPLSISLLYMLICH